jgi:hypothetical protein
VFTFKVIDDFLPEVDQNYILSMVRRLEWQYNPQISGINPESVNTPKWINMAPRQNGFESLIFEGKGTFREWQKLEPLFYALDDLMPFAVDVMRARAGMFMPTPRGGAHIPHVDYYFPHYTLLYYVNDSDGDTILYNEKVETVNFGKDPEYPDRFSILDRVSPKQGRAVLFNGLHYHSSSLPKVSENRIAINVNFIDLATSLR